jgi:rhodanese-related sulfurtransferase/transcriptional regulator with XRE-family HTH domain
VTKSVAASELDALKQQGAVVLDVREPDEFATGHIPGAINLPLGQLRANTGVLPTGKPLLFVCARGSRSMEAGAVAAAAGFTDVYSLQNGTAGWIADGRPVEKGANLTTTSAGAGQVPQRTDQAADDNQPLDPALDKLIAENMRNLRKQRNWTLDDLSRMMNVSRSSLGQIELGNASPSVAIVWKLARAFDVPFSTMLASNQSVATSVMRKANAKRLVSPDGRFSSRALFPFEQRTPVEFYELRLGPHSREQAEPHAFGTRENLAVISGQLELEVGTERYTLEEGDAIMFTADVSHAYVNRTGKECWMHLVMTYA